MLYEVITLARWGSVDDEVPPSVRERRGLLRKAEALRALHAPSTPAETLEARRALAYEELFYLQVMIARRAASRRSDERPRDPPPPGLAIALEERLVITSYSIHYTKLYDPVKATTSAGAASPLRFLRAPTMASLTAVLSYSSTFVSLAITSLV